MRRWGIIHRHGPLVAGLLGWTHNYEILKKQRTGTRTNPTDGAMPERVSTRVEDPSHKDTNE